MFEGLEEGIHWTIGAEESVVVMYLLVIFLKMAFDFRATRKPRGGKGRGGWGNFRLVQKVQGSYVREVREEEGTL